MSSGGTSGMVRVVYDLPEQEAWEQLERWLTDRGLDRGSIPDSDLRVDFLNVRGASEQRVSVWVAKSIVSEE